MTLRLGPRQSPSDALYALARLHGVDPQLVADGRLVEFQAAIAAAKRMERS